MNVITEQKVNKNGKILHFIPTKKYKTLTFVAKFSAPLSRETITKRALLPYVLRQATESYTNRTDLQLKLDDLYGAVLSIDAVKKGDNHIISFRLEIANERYLPAEDQITKEAIHLLKELIYQPYLENGIFSEKIFKREKATLRQRIQAVRDDKLRYANMRLIDEMCKDEVYALHVSGYEEDLNGLTNEQLFQYYQEMIVTNQLDIYVVGDFDPEKMNTEMKEIMVHESADSKPKPAALDIKNIAKVKEIIEKDVIQQAKLHLGYRTNVTFSDKAYPALQVFNGLFGGFPNSKLFINVREKNSLAYYATSQIESHKGLLLVLSGIAPEDFEKARDIIREQMAEMKAGNFTEEDLEETKEMIVHSLKETMDSNQGLVELFYQLQAAETDFSLQDLFTGIEKVTKEDVVEVAQKVEEDTLYLLTAEGGE